MRSPTRPECRSILPASHRYPPIALAEKASPPPAAALSTAHIGIATKSTFLFLLAGPASCIDSCTRPGTLHVHDRLFLQRAERPRRACGDRRRADAAQHRAGLWLSRLQPPVRPLRAHHPPHHGRRGRGGPRLLRERSAARLNHRLTIGVLAWRGDDSPCRASSF